MAKEGNENQKGLDEQVYIWSSKMSANELDEIDKFLQKKGVAPIQQLHLSIEPKLTLEDINELRLQIEASKRAFSKASGNAMNEFWSGITYSIDTLREGLDRSEIDQVAAIVNLTKKEIATLLGRSERNRYYTTSKRLSLLESEHLVNLKLLFSHGLALFDSNVKAFSDWLRTPKKALAVPETGFPVKLSDGYERPTIDDLFAPHTEEENRLAIERNMAFNKSQSTEQSKQFPTPLSILDSPTGLRLVSAILGRIDAGVYS